MSYNDVIFCGLATSTIPSNAITKNFSGGGHYLFSATYVGIANEKNDIDARVDYVKSAIDITCTTLGPNQPNRLKLFMTPEFLFRGANGAYTMEGRDYLIKKLYNLASDPVYIDWLFVFGSIVSCSNSVRPTTIGTNNLFLGMKDDPYHFKEVYNNVLFVQGGWRMDAARRAGTWRRLQGTKIPQNYGEEDFINEMGSELGWIVSKEKRSNIDFAWRDSFINGGSAEVMQQANIYNHSDLLNRSVLATNANCPSDWEVDSSNNSSKKYAGTAVITWDRIKIGVEVCLDHLEGRLKKSARPGDFLHLHLITSAGADIKPTSIMAKQNGGLVFNVDGSREAERCKLTKLVGGQLNPIPVYRCVPIMYSKHYEIVAGGAGQVMIFAPQLIEM